jgi:hypothetical protein
VRVCGAGRDTIARRRGVRGSPLGRGLIPIGLRETAQVHPIAGHAVRIVTPPLFIATKLEAFHGRGANDVFASHDLEDVVMLVDGRPTVTAEVAAAAPRVRAYIATEVRALLDNPDFIEALPVRRVDVAWSNPSRGRWIGKSPDYLGWPRRKPHSPRAESMTVTPPSPPSAQSVQTKKKPPADLAISP